MAGARLKLADQLPKKQLSPSFTAHHEPSGAYQRPLTECLDWLGTHIALERNKPSLNLPDTENQFR